MLCQSPLLQIWQLRIGEELKERLEELKRELENEEDQAHIFMSVPIRLKEAYIKLETGRRYGEHALTIQHNLLLYNPRFLELDVMWAGALFEAEIDEKDK